MLFSLLLLLFFTPHVHSAAEANSTALSYSWYNTEDKVEDLVQNLFTPFMPEEGKPTFTPPSSLEIPERALIEIYLTKGFEAAVDVCMESILINKKYIHFWAQAHDITLSDIPELDELWNQAQEKLALFYSLESYDEKKAFIASLKQHYSLKTNFLIYAVAELFEIADHIKYLFEKEATWRLFVHAQGEALPHRLSILSEIPSHARPLVTSRIPLNAMEALFTNTLPGVPTPPLSDEACLSLAPLFQLPYTQQIKTLSWYTLLILNSQNGGLSWAHSTASTNYPFISFGRPDITAETLNNLPAPLFSEIHLSHSISEKIERYIEEYRRLFYALRNGHNFSIALSRAIAIHIATQHSTLCIFSSTYSDTQTSLTELQSLNPSHPLLAILQEQELNYLSARLMKEQIQLTDEIHLLLTSNEKTLEEIKTEVLAMYREKALTINKNLIVGSFLIHVSYVLKCMYELKKNELHCLHRYLVLQSKDEEEKELHSCNP